MIKFSSSRMKHEILHLLNKSLRTGIFDESWRHTIFRMLPKSGDMECVANWRPIAILPITYKLFTRLLYDRLSPILLKNQSSEQHAFSPGIRIEDALLCAECAIEHALEFNIPLWLLSLDLRKAFDTVDHQSLFQALEFHGISLPYITLLQSLYERANGNSARKSRIQYYEGCKARGRIQRTSV